LSTGRNALSAHLEQHKYPYIILALVVILNIPVFSALVSDWARDGNYSHGFLVIPVSIFLFIRKRGDLIFPAPSNRWGLGLFLLGCLGLIFGTAASEFFTTRLSLVIAVTGLALYYLGSANFKKVWFAFFFLLFMIPIPAIIYYSATLPMQLFASKITGGILHFIGVPAYRQGNVIYLPSYAMEVSEACSGLRSLATLLALGALYGNLVLPGRWRPIVLFLSAVPIAIAVNILRLLITGIGAYAISPKMAEDFLHQISGILVFIVALLIMAALGGILKWERNPS